jgi:peptidyl-prolyl cis-trans isomerase D
MLETLRRGQRWIMALVIAGVGFVFVFYLGLGGAPGGGGGGAGAVVEVDDLRFGPRDVDRVRRQEEENYRRILGDAFDETAADQLDAIAANRLVTQAVLAREARELGLVVSDDEVREYVRRQIPGATDANGRFQAEELRYWVEGEFGTEARFVELVRMEVLADEILDLLRESVQVSDAEARQSLLHRRESVSLAWVGIDAGAPPAGVAIAEEAIDARLASDEAGVRARYDERSRDYQRGEAVHLRHILLQVPEGAPAEEEARVRARAEEALGRLRGGAAFEDLALELSEDPGSRAEGGDLGWVERGTELGAGLEAAAFALTPGTTSELVRTPAGFHILRVEEHREARSVPFEDVRRDLARELLAGEEAAKQAREAAERLAAAVREGKSLVEAAREQRVPIERTEPLQRRADGIIPGLGPAPDVLSAAFALTPERPSPERIFTVGDRLVLIQLLERKTPSPEELAAELGGERERLRQSRLAQNAQLWVELRRSQLESEGRLVYDLGQLRN